MTEECGLFGVDRFQHAEKVNKKDSLKQFGVVLIEQQLIVPKSVLLKKVLCLSGTDRILIRSYMDNLPAVEYAALPCEAIQVQAQHFTWIRIHVKQEIALH